MVGRNNVLSFIRIIPTCADFSSHDNGRKFFSGRQLFSYNVKCTYMYDVSRAVNHDVSVVPILELKQKTQHAVTSHTSDEISSSLLE